MNVVERGAPSRVEAVAGAPPAPAATPAPEAAPAGRKVKLRPLVLLIPYLARYRAQAVAALVALLIAALTTLVVPVAVRRMVDFGFAHDSARLIDSYFAVMIAVAAVLALSSAARFYLVTTLGERIVADLRSEVFGHLDLALDRLFRPGQDRRDHLAAHRRHHADQGGSRLGGVGGAAQSRAVSRRHRHDGGDEPAAVGVRAARDPGDRAAALRFRPRGAGAARARRRTRSRTPRPMRPS